MGPAQKKVLEFAVGEIKTAANGGRDCMRALSFALLAALTATGANAEMAADQKPGLSEVVVTGLPEPKSDRAYDIVELGGEKLRASASGRLEDALFDVAGFQEYRRSDSRAANPTSQGATLRALGGNASSRALVLLDGAPVADPFTGYIPWSALSPDRLADVRITRGAGAGAFGAGALAGVIELNSADPASVPTVQAEADVGSRAAVTVDTVISARVGPGRASIFGRFDRGDGYDLVPANQRGPVDIPASYRQGSVGLHAETPVTGRIDLLANTLAFDDQRVQGLSGTTTEVKGVDSSLRLVGDGAWRWEALAFLQLMNFTNSVAAVNTPRTVETPSLDEYDTPTTGWGGKIEVRPPHVRVGDFRLGADWRDDDGHDSELSKYVRGAFTQRLQAGGHERTAGAFAEWDDEVVRHVTATLGGRIDNWTIDGGSLVESNVQTGAPTTSVRPPDRSKWEPTARGGLAWDATQTISLRAAAYFGYRLPSLNELYRPFRVGTAATAANPSLNPERLKGVEVGGDFSPIDNLRLGVTLFENRLEGAIANVTLGQGPGVFPQVGFVTAGGTFSQRENLDAILARGVEVEAHFALQAWSLDGSYTYTHSRDEASGAFASLNGRPPAQTPEHQVSATLGYAPYAGARISVTGRYVSGQSEDDIGTHILTGVATLDAEAEAPVAPGIKLIVRGENLTDARIETGISAAGLLTLGEPRTIWVGVRVAL